MPFKLGRESCISVDFYFSDGKKMPLGYFVVWNPSQVGGGGDSQWSPYIRFVLLKCQAMRLLVERTKFTVVCHGNFLKCTVYT